MNKTQSVQYPEDIDSFRNNFDDDGFNRAEIERRTPQRDEMADSKDSNEFNSFSDDQPIMWSDPRSIDSKITRVSNLDKKGGDGEEAPDGAPAVDMPNTVLPNPNIYGGFPENDVWGNFELPAPSTIDHLKLALKMNHHRPNYAGIIFIYFNTNICLSSFCVYTLQIMTAVIVDMNYLVNYF